MIKHGYEVIKKSGGWAVYKTEDDERKKVLELFPTKADAVDFMYINAK